MVPTSPTPADNHRLLLPALLWMSVALSAPATLGSDEICPPLSEVEPAAGPAGSVVLIQGQCYPMHSGRSADVYLDDTVIARVGGETGGDFRTLLLIPAGARPGRHVIRLTQGDAYRLTSGFFDVTRSPEPCAGDCNQDGQVDVDEVVTSIGIGLDELEPGNCPAFDSIVEALTIADIVAAVRNALEGCSLFPDLESFVGAYDVLVGEVGELAFPGRVTTHPGEADVLDGLLFLEFEYFPGRFIVSGAFAEDGSLLLDGIFEQDEVDPVLVNGSVVLTRTQSGEWIGGELVYDRPGALESQILRFTMQR